MIDRIGSLVSKTESQTGEEKEEGEEEEGVQEDEDLYRKKLFFQGKRFSWCLWLESSLLATDLQVNIKFL